MKIILPLVLGIILETASAKLGAFGVNYSNSWLSNLVSLDTSATADVNLGYHLPYSTFRQYLKLSPTLDLSIASLNHFAFSLLDFVSLRLELNVIGVKAQPWGAVMVDAIKYSDLCGDAGVKINAAEIELKLRRLDVKDCNLGALGAIIQLFSLFNLGPGTKYGTVLSCEWKNYRFEEPLLRFGLDRLGLETNLEYRLDKPSCLNPPVVS